MHLGGDLGAPDDARHRPNGAVHRSLEVLELFLHQQAGNLTETEAQNDLTARTTKRDASLQTSRLGQTRPAQAEERERGEGTGGKLLYLIMKRQQQWGRTMHRRFSPCALRTW